MTMQPNDREDALRLAREADAYVMNTQDHIHFTAAELERFYQRCRDKFAKKAEIPVWTEEDKARLEVALFGKCNKPLAWVRADGKLSYTDESDGVYRCYPLILDVSPVLTSEPAPTEGATPETDALYQPLPAFGAKIGILKIVKSEQGYNHACQLERQRNELRERVKELEAWLDHIAAPNDPNRTELLAKKRNEAMSTAEIPMDKDALRRIKGMNPPEEATPFTDAQEFNTFAVGNAPSYSVVGSGFARSMERELAQLRRQVAERENDLKLWRSGLHYTGEGTPHFDRAVAELILKITPESSSHALISALAAERGKAFMEQGAAIAEWLNELYAVMVDPCAEGTMRVVDTKAAIMKSALATREELNRRANTQSALGNTDGDST